MFSPKSRGDREMFIVTSSIQHGPKYPGEGNDNPLQYFCLQNPMDRGARESMGLQTLGHDCATNTF